MGGGGWGAISRLEHECCRRRSQAPSIHLTHLQTLNLAHKTFTASGRLEESEACHPSWLTDKGQTGSMSKLCSGGVDSLGHLNRHQNQDTNQAFLLHVTTWLQLGVMAQSELVEKHSFLFFPAQGNTK